MHRLRQFILLGSLLVLAAAVPSFAQESSRSGKAYWNGLVDNKVQLVVRGLSLEQKAIEGQTLADGGFSFTAPLPAADMTVRVTKIDGRSNRVSVVQQPSSANDFTAIIEIHDERGGSDEYFVEITW